MSLKRKTTGHKIVVAGKTFSSIRKAAEAHGQKYKTVHMRLKTSRSIDEAFG